jgi:transaldolase
MKNKFRVILDTAEIAHIRDAAAAGLTDGVATNPTKVAQSGKSYKQVVAEIREVFDGPIAVQALGDTVDELCDCARRLHQISQSLVIKIATNKVGLAAIKRLTPEGIWTQATLVFSPAQALMAGLAGAPSISTFIGRATMAGADAIENVRKMRQVLDTFGIKTVLMAASIKSVDQVINSIIAGADGVAIPYNIFEAMCDHPMTRDGLAGFTDDYKKIPKS